jgi:hypothetical protein
MPPATDLKAKSSLTVNKIGWSRAEFVRGRQLGTKYGVAIASCGIPTPSDGLARRRSDSATSARTRLLRPRFALRPLLSCPAPAVAPRPSYRLCIAAPARANLPRAAGLRKALSARRVARSTCRPSRPVAAGRSAARRLGRTGAGSRPRRTLARAALDQYTTQALLKLATEYEARAAEAEIRDSPRHSE